MTSPTAALAPPPPLANLTSEASPAAAFDVGTPPGEGLPPNVVEGASTDDLAYAEARVAEAADANPPAKSEKMRDFIGQANDMAFGPNHESTKFDFAAYQETLVNNKVLPEFALDEGPGKPMPHLHADAGKAKAEHAIFKLKMDYFALKQMA